MSGEDVPQVDPLSQKEGREVDACIVVVCLRAKVADPTRVERQRMLLFIVIESRL